MCAPIAVLLPYAAAALTVAGTAYAVKSQGDAAQYQAQVDTNNAKVASQEATNANAAGSYAADQARIRGNLQRGQQLAGFAANNVDSTTGSAADILGDTAMFTAQDERQARVNASQQAYGFQVQGLNDTGAASYALYSGKEAQIGSLISGGSQLAGIGNKAGWMTPAPSGGSTALTGGVSGTTWASPVSNSSWYNGQGIR